MYTLHEPNKKLEVRQVPRYVKGIWDLKKKVKIKTKFSNKKINCPKVF